MFLLWFVVSGVAQARVGLSPSSVSAAGSLAGALAAVLEQSSRDTGCSAVCGSSCLWPTPAGFQLPFSHCVRIALGYFWYVFTSSDVLLLSLLLYIRPWCRAGFVTVKWVLSKWLDFEDHGDTFFVCFSAEIQKLYCCSHLPRSSCLLILSLVFFSLF